MRTFKKYINEGYYVTVDADEANHAYHYEKEIEDILSNPDYLFARVNKAIALMEAGDYDNVPEYMGAGMVLGELYPQRNIFHFTEVMTYYKVAVFYFTGIGDLEQAAKRLDIMFEIDPISHDTILAQSAYHEALMSKSRAITQEITSEIIHRLKQTTNAPVFHHEIIWDLYINYLSIDPETINEILELPKQSLTADLELILTDSINRFSLYKSEFDATPLTSNAPLHAILLLTELEAESSLPLMLDVLRQPEEYHDYWFGDHVTETLWEDYMKLGKNQLPALMDFVLEPGRNVEARELISSAISQLPHYDPDKRAEVIGWYRSVFEHFLNYQGTMDKDDNTLLAFMADDILDFNGIELEDILFELFENDLIDHKIITRDDLKSGFANPDEFIDIRETSDIYDRYEDLAILWSDFQDEDEDEEEYNEEEEDDWLDSEDFEYQAPFINESPKTGRNDPCPCGSGKKYKKCCGG